MADPISPRAQAILDEIERGAGARRAPVPDFAVPTPAARPDLPEPPRSGFGRSTPATHRATPAPAKPTAGRDEEFTPVGEGLRRLVDDVVTQAEAVRVRLSALSEAIEDIAGRLGAPEQANEEPYPVSPGGEVVEMARRPIAKPTMPPPAPGLVAGEEPPAQPASGEGGPDEQDDTSWMAQAVLVDDGRSVPARLEPGPAASSGRFEEPPPVRRGPLS